MLIQAGCGDDVPVPAGCSAYIVGGARDAGHGFEKTKEEPFLYGRAKAKCRAGEIGLGVVEECAETVPVRKGLEVAQGRFGKGGNEGDGDGREGEEKGEEQVIHGWMAAGR